jgi:hypothetical protein
MATPVKRKVKIIEAKYVEDADSILILGECQEGRFRQQINSSCFSFGDKNKKTEMITTAELMLGKTIYIVFDPDLDERIKDHSKIKY